MIARQASDGRDRAWSAKAGVLFEKTFWIYASFSRSRRRQIGTGLNSPPIMGGLDNAGKVVRILCGLLALAAPVVGRVRVLSTPAQRDDMMRSSRLAFVMIRPKGCDDDPACGSMREFWEMVGVRAPNITWTADADDTWGDALTPWASALYEESASSGAVQRGAPLFMRWQMGHWNPYTGDPKPESVAAAVQGGLDWLHAQNPFGLAIRPDSLQREWETHMASQSQKLYERARSKFAQPAPCCPAQAYIDDFYGKSKLAEDYHWMRTIGFNMSHQRFEHPEFPRDP